MKALLLGLAPFLQMPSVFVATVLVGSIILFWMAFGMFRSLSSLHLYREENQRRGNHPMVNGILMSIANPYWLIWWATIGLGYILYSWRFGFWGVAFFFAGHILADLVFANLSCCGGRQTFDFTAVLWRSARSFSLCLPGILPMLASKKKAAARQYEY